MQNFTQGITTAMNVPQIGTAFPGGFRFGRMPEGSQYPYLVANIVAAPVVTAYKGVEFYEPTIRFVGFGVGLNAMLANMQVLTDLLDQTVLPLPSGNEVNTLRKSDPTPTLTDEVDGSGNEVWRVDVIYQFAISS